MKTLLLSITLTLVTATCIAQCSVYVGVLSGNLNHCFDDTFTVILKPSPLDAAECAAVYWSDGATTFYDTVHTGGVYYVTIIDTGGCQATSNSPFYITVWPQVVPTIIQNGDTLTTANAATYYQWYLNDTLIPGAVARQFLPIVSGNYKVLVTLSPPFYCSGFSDSYYYLLSNITSSKSPQTRLKISPNPFSTQLTFSLAENEQTTVSLYNFLGQQVLQKAFTNSTTINTEQMQSGIYFYELRTEKGALKTGKLVKQ